MKKLIVATVAALSALASMAYDTPLVLEITGTESLTAALGGQSLAGHDALVKSGAGTLTVGADDVAAISSFGGDIVVSAGVLRISAAGALGTADGKTVVEKEAQLYIDSKSADLDFTAETMEIVGEGPDGTGAIFANNKDSNARNFGSVKLVDDATIGYATTCTFNRYNNNEQGVCDLGGKTLTFKTSGTKIVSVYGTFTAGNVLLNNAKMILAGGATFQGSAENWIAATNRGAVAYNWYQGSAPVTLRPLDASMTLEVRAAGDTGAYNTYDGPVDLDKGRIIVTKVANAKTPGASFSGKISGAHGIQSTEASAGLTLRLTNAENDFEGGVSVDGSTLVVPVSGALPADGGPLTLTTNATLQLSQAVYALPNAFFAGLVTVDGEAASGSWRQVVTKAGEGQLEYNTYIGAPVLDLQGGTVKLPVARTIVTTNRIAGLKGGCQTYATSEAVKAAWGDTTVLFDDEQSHLTPEMAYRAGTTQSWEQYMLWTYSGYIWNRSSVAETWTFASCILARGSVYLDGQPVVVNESPASEGQTGGVKQGTVTVAPGAHKLEIRMHTTAVNQYTAGGGGAYYNAKLANDHGTEKGYAWSSLSGIMLDRQGRGSHDVADYSKIVDAGDGDFLTQTDAQDVITKVVAQFDAIVATNGVSTLDLNGQDYTVANVVGFPAFANCGTIVVTNALTVGRDAYASKAMTADGKVTFGEGAKVVVDFGGKFRPTANSVAILTAADGIEGEPAVEVADGVRGTFSLHKSVDGKTLCLDYQPDGMILIFR